MDGFIHWPGGGWRYYRPQGPIMGKIDLRVK